MTRVKTFLLIAVLPLAGAAVMAAQRPAALASTAPGLWEIDGLPGGKPVRECVSEVAALAQYEHRSKNCARNLINDGPSSAVIQYQCAGNDFGRSKISVITPRSLRIETQGISDSLPFGYVLQARRISDCPDRQTAARH